MDNFALLGQPRRPWVDPEQLKTAFLERSTREHPDRVHAAGASQQAAASDRYAELNAAYNCLRDPKERLGHLLELEQGAPPAAVQKIPPDTMDLFAKVGQCCREADRIIAAKAAASGPLLQAQWFVQSTEFNGKLVDLQGQIRLLRDGFLAELRSMDNAWNSAPPTGSPGRAAALPLRRLEEIYRMFSYTGRWSAQLQERFVQLAI